jgi:transketolase
MLPLRPLRATTDHPPDPARGGEADERPPHRPGDGGDERTQVSPLASAQSLEERCIDTIRFLAVDGVQKANSGHPGMPMGAAPVAHTLFTRHLRFDPADPAWPDRDRFVLSAGHASMLLYSLLHLTGYDVTIDDLRAFRQWDSRTPGHPEYGHTAGVETTTGPLGQGFANAVGMAVAERFLAATFNGNGPDVMDHFTYVLAGDGDNMEGVSSEAASFAGHQKLGKLIVFYDDNHITIDGSTDLAFTEDVCARFAAYGWHVQRVGDGNDVAAIDAAVTAAKAEMGSPSLIAVRTHIAFGSPNKQDTAGAHGAPLGPDEVKLTKENRGWPLEPTFFVPDEVKAFYREAARRGAAAHAAWKDRFATWHAADAARAQAWDDAWARRLPDDWDADLPVFKPEDGAVATRSASGKVINALAPHLPTLLGGSADLAPSNNTLIKDVPDQQVATPAGRNFHFGVREHAMAAIGNGLSLHGGLHPYVATFFVFVDYMRPAMRLSAIMKQPLVYVLTHDSVGVGEDGPTHQPIEHLAILRATPGFTDIRPADASETVEAWKIALQHGDGPVALMLTRQNLPIIDRSTCAPASGVTRGAYVLADADGGAPELILIASGSEVQHALAAHERLTADGVRSRVVNMASFALFAGQDAAYRESVLPAACRRRLAVEAGASLGWHRWIGDDGEVIALDRFGASAPAGTIFEQLGFTAENVYRRAKALLG